MRFKINKCEYSNNIFYFEIAKIADTPSERTSVLFKIFEDGKYTIEIDEPLKNDNYGFVKGEFAWVATMNKKKLEALLLDLIADNQLEFGTTVEDIEAARTRIIAEIKKEQLAITQQGVEASKLKNAKDGAMHIKKALVDHAGTQVQDTSSSETKITSSNSSSSSSSGSSSSFSSSSQSSQAISSDDTGEISTQTASTTRSLADLLSSVGSPVFTSATAVTEQALSAIGLDSTSVMCREEISNGEENYLQYRGK